MVAKGIARDRPLTPAQGYTTPEAFTGLHQRTHRNVYRYVWGLTGGPTAWVEDITAETYARAWKARERIQPNEGQALSFLLTTARNLVIDEGRKAKTRGVQLTLEDVTLTAEASAQPERHAQLSEHVAKLLGLLDGLPTDTREMLVLRYALDWPVERIATHLGKTPNAVYVACHRALKTLRGRWSHSEGGNPHDTR